MFVGFSDLVTINVGIVSSDDRHCCYTVTQTWITAYSLL